MCCATHPSGDLPHADSPLYTGEWMLRDQPEALAALAGLLAEHGFTTLTLTREASLSSPNVSAPDQATWDQATTEVLAARVTDLPGKLQHAAPCTLCITTLIALTLQITPESIRWSTPTQSLHHDLVLLAAP